MEDKVSINAKVGNRSYKIKVDPQHEKYVRSVLQSIQTRMNQFKIQFPGMDEQDYLSMTLLDHITSTANNPNSFQDQEMKNRLEKISKLLDA